MRIFLYWNETTDNVKAVTGVVVKTTTRPLNSTTSFQRYLVYIVDILNIIKNILPNKK